MNKGEYGLHVFIESLYNDIAKSIQKIYRKTLFCIDPYSVRIRENKVQNTPYSVFLCSAIW